MGLDAVEVILAIEEEFAISVPDDCPDLVNVVTVRDLAVIVLKCIGEQRDEAPDPEAVLARTVQIVDEHSSRWFKKKVTPEARLQDVLSM